MKLPPTIPPATVVPRGTEMPNGAYGKTLASKATIGEANALAAAALRPALIAATWALRFAAVAFVVSLLTFVLVLWRIR